MSFQTNNASIVRWGALALILGTAACAGDSVTAPQAADEIQAITADAKGGKAAGAENVAFEPQRYRQVRQYNAGSLTEFGVTNASTVYRICQLNSYEDRDGNDFVHLDRNASYRKEHINEADGFVLIQQWLDGDWQPTHIGRADWSGQFWFDAAERGNQTLVRSYSQGVVLPILDANGNSRMDGDLDDLLRWLRAGEAGQPGYQPGSWLLMSSADYLAALADPNVPDPILYSGDPSVDEEVMVGARDAPGYDLLNDPLGIIPIHPDPDIVGTEGRAVATLNRLLNRYSDELVGSECDADYSLAGFDAAGEPVYTVRHNEIRFAKTWPKQLDRLYR